MKDKLVQLSKAVWSAMSRRTLLKLLSFAFAIMLWSYVISSSPSITRTKTIDDLTGYVSGQATLEIYKLALLTDPTFALSDISVQVQVPQASYSQVTGDNVQVSLDISAVRTAGTQEVPLKATSAYGKVVRIYPAALTLTFETLDSRSVPVQVSLSGMEETGYWYNTARYNPQQLTVTGATSLVQSIASARVVCDVADRHGSFTAARTFTLLDERGEEITQTMLNPSASSITVGVDIYPTKELEVSTAIDDVLDGQVAPGYQIESIAIQPETVTVAAEQELLDAIDKLVISPIAIDAPSQSFTKPASISGLTDFKYISSEQVYVTVQIAEETVSAWIEDVYINYSPSYDKDKYLLSWQRNTISVHVTGPRSKVQALVDKGLTATADLSGLGEGNHAVPIEIDDGNLPDIVFEPELNEVEITLTPRTAE